MLIDDLVTAYHDSGLSHAVLAARAGVDVNTVFRALHGHNCTLRVLEALATVLGLRIAAYPIDAVAPPE